MTKIVGNKPRKMSLFSFFNFQVGMPAILLISEVVEMTWKIEFLSEREDEVIFWHEDGNSKIQRRSLTIGFAVSVLSSTLYEARSRVRMW